MNAYELAQYLEIAFYEDEDIEKAATMLRQQADRIAELEKQGEPVAWIRSGDDQLSLVKEKDDGYMVWKPLYLAPQTKPLSDEEINQLSGYHIEIEWFDEGEYGMEYNIYGVKDLVRAIEERHGIK